MKTSDVFLAALLAGIAPAQTTLAISTPTSPQDCTWLEADGDCNDSCPVTPTGTAANPAGCPVIIDGGLLVNSVHFKPGSSRLSTAAQHRLDAAIDFLSHQPNLKVGIDGHTDACPSPRRSARLALARARVVYRYLLAHGLSADRIAAVKGYGASYPLEETDKSCDSEINRRVELSIEPAH
ncbi:hypothetical protein CO615_07570 [Lysobacteraceae bacterium NML75-0749]|nr:hypothetical protein CO615_07570 [Xanthomonadaceae bacterium NML75-0749]PJK05824.1 hypothetical protein CO609_02460 [Xanthomonadaceae bacterium NML91-0268]